MTEATLVNRAMWVGDGFGRSYAQGRFHAQHHGAAAPRCADENHVLAKDAPW